jgi:integrase
MPRQSRGAYLWLRKATFDKTTGKLKANATWLIKDGSKSVATGCAADEVTRAEERLAAYIAEKNKPERKRRDIEEIDVAEVLSVYDEDCREQQLNKVQHDGRIERLAEWWGGKTLADINGETCRAYVRHRQQAARKPHPKGVGGGGRKAGIGGPRRDLETLRAAINHHLKAGLHREIVQVTLPAKGQARDRWLTRSEAAKLLWYCWRTKDDWTSKYGLKVESERRTSRHVARFILIGLYTGTRATAITCASPYKGLGRSWVDLDRGLFYRLPEGKKRSKKRQPTVRLPSRLLAHMRRWARATEGKDGPPVINTHFVEFHGQPVSSVGRGLEAAVKACGLEGGVTPHTLRHTAATWLMQSGADKFEVAGFLGMSLQTLDTVYGHHHPDFQTTISEALSVRGRARTNQKMQAAAAA